MMKSAGRGQTSSTVEVTNISARGFWLLLDSNEKYVAFKDFPWFSRSTRSITPSDTRW